MASTRNPTLSNEQLPIKQFPNEASRGHGNAIKSNRCLQRTLSTNPHWQLGKRWHQSVRASFAANVADNVSQLLLSPSRNIAHPASTNDGPVTTSAKQTYPAFQAYIEECFCAMHLKMASVQPCRLCTITVWGGGLSFVVCKWDLRVSGQRKNIRNLSCLAYLDPIRC